MKTFANKLGYNPTMLQNLARSLKIELERHPGETDDSYYGRLNHAVRTWKKPEPPPPPPAPEPKLPVVPDALPELVQVLPKAEAVTTDMVAVFAELADACANMDQTTLDRVTANQLAEELDPDAAHMAAINQLVAGLPATDEDAKNTLRLVATALVYGTSADKLAKHLGLNRDKFVRPRAKLLRDNGLWVDGQLAVATLTGSEDEIRLAVLLGALVAEGLVEVGTTEAEPE